MLLGGFRSPGRCSLTWAALSFVTMCLNKSGKRLSGPTSGELCTSMRACLRDIRISPRAAILTTHGFPSSLHMHLSHDVPCTPCLGKSDNKHLKKSALERGSPFEPSFSPSSWPAFD